MSQDRAEFSMEADVQAESEPARTLRYRLGVAIEPRTGSLSAADERLDILGSTGEKKGRSRIELDSTRGVFVVRKRRETGRELTEAVGENHSIVSVPAFSGENHPEIDAVRSELSKWRTYYLDPRISMRRPTPPAEVDDIGPMGENLASFLFLLKNRDEHFKRFEAVSRMVRAVISSVDKVDVDLNEKRAEVELLIRQDGIEFSNRVISEGTLRVLGLAAICVNPFGTRLVCFEEPENGVQPRRLENIAEMLAHLALNQGVQVVVNTHSPLFVSQMFRVRREHSDDVAILNVRRTPGGSAFSETRDPGELFEQSDINRLIEADEDARVQAVLLRGLLDG